MRKAATLIDVAASLAAYSPADIAETMGVSRRTVDRWIVNGVDVWTADKLASKVVGDHAAVIWGRSWVDAIDELVGEDEED